MTFGSLNPRQQQFCKLYATSQEFFCNGVQSYMQAYCTKNKQISYGAARTGASKLLANVSISKYINELLEEQGLNNQFVDKQLAMLITQHADLNLKLAAIREYNKIRDRGMYDTEEFANKKITVVLPGTSAHPRFTPKQN